MRAIINVPDEQVVILNQLSKRKKLSRAEIVRQALKLYIDNTNIIRQEYDNAFGMWRNKDTNNVEYQQKLRSEW